MVHEWCYKQRCVYLLANTVSHSLIPAIYIGLNDAEYMLCYKHIIYIDYIMAAGVLDILSSTML